MSNPLPTPRSPQSATAPHLITLADVLSVLDGVAVDFARHAPSRLAATLVQAAVWWITARIQALPRESSERESATASPSNEGGSEALDASALPAAEPTHPPTAHVAGPYAVTTPAERRPPTEPVQRALPLLPPTSDGVRTPGHAVVEGPPRLAVASGTTDPVVRVPDATPAHRSGDVTDAAAARAAPPPPNDGPCAVGSRLFAAAAAEAA